MAFAGRYQPEGNLSWKIVLNRCAGRFVLMGVDDVCPGQ
jgi:hypothetical protein